MRQDPIQPGVGSDVATGRRTVRVGMGQMLVAPGPIEDNLTRAVAMIETAAREGCAFVLLPECLDLGWISPDAGRLAQPIPGPASDRMGVAAAGAAIMVGAGGNVVVQAPFSDSEGVLVAIDVALR